MNKISRAMTAAMGTLAAASFMTHASGTQIVFVGCPILRNTALPCWLGEDRGELYYLGPQGDLTAKFYPPEFQHKMLVEGEISDAPRICGGIVLKPVKVSVLPDLDVTCNVTLPAAGFADPPNNRGPGPSGARGVAPKPPPRPVPIVYTAPFIARHFDVMFNADTERLWMDAQNVIEAAAHYADVADARRIDITGYRAVTRLSNGQNYVERADIAKRRAEVVEQALRTLVVPAKTHLTMSWRDSAAPSSALQPGPDGRRVSLTVVP
jgi:outer membrane protein OmpA-like peptidoglycan-associated protein